MQTGKKNSEHHQEKNTVGQDAILKVSKEITVKFIEMGRITPTTFAETFKDIHRTIRETIDEE